MLAQERVPYQGVGTPQSGELFMLQYSTVQYIHKMPKAQRSKSLPNTKNSSLIEHQVAVAGSIYWLPPKNKHDIRLLQLYPVDDGLFDHPVVVISTNTEKKEALAFVVGTYINKTLLTHSDRPSSPLLGANPF